ncbi:ATP-dependent DNA helicase [Trichonephila clavipes]|nr:ATP-dependent DNA helicase [Trichonephila clavipes]
MIDLLVKGKIFGCVRCFMFSVEWQKRGLPHAHILIWLETKIRAEQIDDVIRAELPDQEVDPELFDVVKTHMVHGPCGSYNPRSPCIKNGICSKKFPKPFSTETVIGSDLAVFGVQNANDEVTPYQNGRYISTSEAIWRMLSFSIHERFPAVTHLDIHLENDQRVYFDPSNVRTVVENPRNTTLMAFFDMCHKDEFTASLLYEEIPGIAATLLHGEKTAHSMFKIPLESERMENSVCSVTKNSDKVKVLQDCVFVVRDECTMANKISIEAVNRTMQDLRGITLLFGGATFLFAGDFRQILPVVTKGTRAYEINACLRGHRGVKNVSRAQNTNNFRLEIIL